MRTLPSIKRALLSFQLAGFFLVVLPICAQAAQSGSYSVLVSNLFGSVISTPSVTAMVTADSPSSGAVLVWSAISSGLTTVPVAAQSGVTAIAAGGYAYIL